MYLMYVDESGDPGKINSATRYFTLSGLVVNESRWLPAMIRVADFRQRMRSSFGLKLREEIHSAKFITSPGNLVRIPKHDRLSILRHFADELSAIAELSIINVIVDKQGKPSEYDVYDHAWQTLVQRFENTLIHNNFPDATVSAQRGMVVADGQPSAKLIAMLRKMRSYNPIPNQTGNGFRNLMMKLVIEDPNFRDSAHSQLIQAADLIAFLLYQQEQPNSYMRKSGGRHYFSRLTPILCRHACPRDPQGIVRL